MCLIAFALGASPRWPLVIAANRDEFLDRPTLPLAPWRTPAGKDIVSGRDLRAGGAWFGVTPGGRIAFLTNVREAEAAPAPRSRGELVTRWLESPDNANDFLAGLNAEPQAFAGAIPGSFAGSYAGFNLVLGDFDAGQWHWVTNRPPAALQQSAPRMLHHEVLKPGIYGLSNAALDSPWPKTTQLKRVLQQSLQVNGPTSNLAALRLDLWQALGSRERAGTADLPATGIPLAREQALSSAFVELPGEAYGTRSSTILIASDTDQSAFDLQPNVHMEEREYLRPVGEVNDPSIKAWRARAEDLIWPVTP